MISDEDVANAKTVLESYILSFAVSKEFIAELLNENHMIVYRCRQWGWFDTEQVSELANALSKKVLGKRWPKYKDGLSDKQMDEFQDKLQEKIVGRIHK